MINPDDVTIVEYGGKAPKNGKRYVMAELRYQGRTIPASTLDGSKWYMSRFDTPENRVWLKAYMETLRTKFIKEMNSNGKAT